MAIESWGSTCLPSPGAEIANTCSQAQPLSKARASLRASFLSQASFLLFFVFCLFFKTGFLCSPGSPRTHSVDQAGLELTELHLPLPPECRIKE